MRNNRTLTKSAAKRAEAAAISEFKHRHAMSNADVGDVMGASDGTVRNRMDADDADKGLTVYELARLINDPRFGPEFGSAVLSALTGYVVSAPDAAPVPWGRIARKLSGLVHAIDKAREDDVIDASEDAVLREQFADAVPDFIGAAAARGGAR